jgi:hypothetical protein
VLEGEPTSEPSGKGTLGKLAKFTDMIISIALEFMQIKPASRNDILKMFVARGDILNAYK